MSRIKLVILGLVLSSFTVHAAVTDTEWKVGTECLEANGLPPHKLLCMAVDKKELKSIMRAGFMIGTKTRQTWCSMIDKLGLRSSAGDARGKEGMAECDANDDYENAFSRGGEVVRCMTDKVFADYNQWGLLATHMYYCEELNSSGDCVAAVEIAKGLRGREPDCKLTGSLWKWSQKLDYVRTSLDSVYNKNCSVKPETMLSYCESVLKDKKQCKSLYSK
ncbi:hypothetical protein QUF74_06780 [Candidatus Halobeggiatoa sp. HSG11]|nr:hypothetical protein [Candidatus Halobeggiatoa sp. HSG11]